MKVVLMSDSHGRNDVVDKIIEMNQDAVRFFHCGDIECDEFIYPDMVTVAGNNDYYGNYPQQLIFTLGTHKILMMHSHRCFAYGRGRFQGISEMAKKEGCDTVFFGHTHVAFDEVVDGVRLINPGSLYYSRDCRPISYCVIEVNNDLHVEFKFAPFK